MKKTLPRTLIIRVTKTDIRNGSRGYGDQCPIARAGRRALRVAGFLNEFVSVSTYRFSVFARRSEEVKGRYYLPSEASTFVCSFDEGAPVQPIAFFVTLIP